ncbi:RNB domain-containing ribonuclease [Nocardioides sp.]|uniref:RNB domain-containing ribonuclease n=1 Tax=Nocardioides sp. TaxID=35761 RepID=UPI003D096A23
MPTRVLSLHSRDEGVAAHTLRDGIARIQAELHVTSDFPDEVEAAAAQAAARPRLPSLDRTDLPFVTIDPASAMDLDQAMHIERAGDGYTVYYAIADVAAFVTAGDPVDLEAHRRGETLYGADSKIPLHPKVISEDAGSLLAGQVRPALLWEVAVDATGEGTSIQVQRALVKSREKLSYDGVQQAIDDGTAPEVFTLLKEIGQLRLAKEAERGGVSLPLPEQEIDIAGDRWQLEFREQHAVEQWNAQISLLVGIGAATLMMQAGVGFLRTLPPADPRDLKRLHRTARSLQIDWPADQPYPEFIRSLDPTQSRDAAMVVASTRVLRGAAYVGFDGAVPPQARQAAIAAEYAHVTAPLRRLADRYAGEICLAICAGQPVPQWVLDELDTLPETMRDSARRASQYENAILSLVEAAVLQHRVGEEFAGVVVEVDDRDERRGDVSIPSPAIEAVVTSDRPLPLGDAVTVTLTKADVNARQVAFSLGAQATVAP